MEARREGKQMLNGANAAMVAVITGRSRRWESGVQSKIDIVWTILEQRNRWVGHILRMNEERQVRQVLLAAIPDNPPYPAGSLFEGFNTPRIRIIEDAVTRKGIFGSRNVAG